MKYIAIVGSEIFWKGIRLRVLWRADGIPDMDIRNTGNGNDGADFCLLNLHTL